VLYNMISRALRLVFMACAVMSIFWDYDGLSYGLIAKVCTLVSIAQSITGTISPRRCQYISLNPGLIEA
jgi:hypothetical protein